jgi:hypothetical protein
MGAAHVAMVYTSWSHLPDRPFRALVYMALQAKDSHTDPQFWGGRESLCQCLGLDPDAEPDRHKVKRAVRTLTDTGALEIVYHGHAGKRTVYRINVLQKEATQRPPVPTPDGPQRGPLGDRMGAIQRPKGGQPKAPLGEQREQGPREEPKSPSPVLVTRPESESEERQMDMRLARSILMDMDPDAARKLKLSAPVNIAGDTARTIWAAEQVMARKSA